MFKYKTIIFDVDGTLFKTETITDVDILQDEAQEAERNLFETHGELYEGIVEMLNKLNEDGYTLCICTSGSKTYVNRILEAFDLKEMFVVVKSKAEGVPKSQQIKEILDETESNSAVVVGDRYNDFEAAKDNGCLSIGVSYGYGGTEYLQADFTTTAAVHIHRIIDKINGLYYDVTEKIVTNKKKDKPIIVGVNGIDTSGKTVFTEELANYLKKMGFPVETIHMDDFHNPSDIRNKGDNPGLSYIENAFDLNRIEEELLKPIAENNILEKELTVLDLESDRFTIRKKYAVNSDTIILFEGVLLFRDPLNKYFNLRIYLDISLDEVLRRAASRDGYLFGSKIIEKYRNKYIPIQQWYIEKYQPKKISEIVINNEDYYSPQFNFCANPTVD